MRQHGPYTHTYTNNINATQKNPEIKPIEQYTTFKRKLHTKVHYKSAMTQFFTSQKTNGISNISNSIANTDTIKLYSEKTFHVCRRCQQKRLETKNIKNITFVLQKNAVMPLDSLTLINSTT